MMRYNIIFLIFAAAFALGQECPAIPYESCGGCSGNTDEPIILETATPGSAEHLCNVTLAWNYDGDSDSVMVFTCSYDDGSLCYESEADVCQSCGSVNFPELNVFRNPSIVYSDTCGNVNIFPAAIDCVPEVTTTEHPEGCQRAFKFIGGRCIFVDPFLNATWAEAQFFCREFNADLVIIDDDELYLGILQYIEDNELSGASYWIGGVDKLIDGVFTWLNGEPMVMGTPYWAVYGVGNDDYIQEPKDIGVLNYDCVQMDSERYLYYADDDCDNRKAAICEQPRVSFSFVGA